MTNHNDSNDNDDCAREKQTLPTSSSPSSLPGGVDNSTSSTSGGGSGGTDSDLIIRDGFPALYYPTTTSSSTTTTEEESDKTGSVGTKQPEPQLQRRPILTEGDEPSIPQHVFWTCENAIEFSPSHLETLRHDCEVVFTARDKPDGISYSAGQTYFIPSNVRPRCALEQLALSIFHQHTCHLPKGTFDPSISGANWWTLVLDDDNDDNDDSDGNGEDKKDYNEGDSKTAKDEKRKSRDDGDEQQDHDDDQDEDDDDDEDDEVGLHFDADYELEDQTNSNIMLHPRVATVTYLSDSGAPTFVLNQCSPPINDQHKKTLHNSTIDVAWLSHPKLGKHTAFDGRLLHGAPALYFPPMTTTASTTTATADEDDGDERSAKRVKLTPAVATATNTTTTTTTNTPETNKRYTLLVNVWLNHWVMDAALLDDDVISKLQTPLHDIDSSSVSNSISNIADSTEATATATSDVFRWKISANDMSKPITTKFGSTANSSTSSSSKEVPSSSLPSSSADNHDNHNNDDSVLKVVRLCPSSIDPAGEDEIVLCNHNVTVKYNPTMEECHQASAIGSTVQLQLEPNTITLEVGDEVVEEEGDDDEQEDEKH